MHLQKSAVRRAVVFLTAFALLFSPAAPLVWAGPAFAEFIDPNPAPLNFFGDLVVPLSTGNVVITSPGDDAGGIDFGAVYLFNGATGALISTLTGSSPGDFDASPWGQAAVTPLSNGNYVVTSNGAQRGAVTFGNGMTGVSGTVSPANSLIGTATFDFLGGGFDGRGVLALSNGNYVVVSPMWDNGAVVDAGAVTWGNGSTGTVGPVSAANSLVGTVGGDSVGEGWWSGRGVLEIGHGNYLVVSPSWNNGAAVDAGAVTWVNGATGIVGPVSAANSLVGTASGDAVGRSGVTVLSNLNYVLGSMGWDNGGTADVGAATWGSGTTGIIGPVSAANSLIGAAAYDGVCCVFALTNGNYVVTSWVSATWGNGATGTSGVISAANSLVGTKRDDFSSGEVKALSNGNYVVLNPSWDNGGTANVGAATWGNGATGVSGTSVRQTAWSEREWTTSSAAGSKR